MSDDITIDMLDDIDLDYEPEQKKSIDCELDEVVEKVKKRGPPKHILELQRQYEEKQKDNGVTKRKEIVNNVINNDDGVKIKYKQVRIAGKWVPVPIREEEDKYVSPDVTPGFNILKEIIEKQGGTLSNIDSSNDIDSKKEEIIENDDSDDELTLDPETIDMLIAKLVALRKTYNVEEKKSAPKISGAVLQHKLNQLYSTAKNKSELNKIKNYVKNNDISGHSNKDISRASAQIRDKKVAVAQPFPSLKDIIVKDTSLTDHQKTLALRQLGSKKARR